MPIEVDRCRWCGLPIGDGPVLLRAPDDEGCLLSVRVCSGCYREAMHDPGFTPVRVWKGGDREGRVVRLPDASYLVTEVSPATDDP